jgi:hypothetical protein
MSRVTNSKNPVFYRENNMKKTNDKQLNLLDATAMRIPQTKHNNYAESRIFKHVDVDMFFKVAKCSKIENLCLLWKAISERADLPALSRSGIQVAVIRRAVRILLKGKRGDSSGRVDARSAVRDLISSGSLPSLGRAESVDGSEVDCTELELNRAVSDA